MDAVFDQGRYPPCPGSFNLAAHVLGQAEAHPQKTALAILGMQDAQVWSYARLRAAVLGTASGLLRAGVAPGQIVLMRLGNTVEFPIAYLGAIAAGIVPVPTSSQLTAPEVAKMIAQVSPAAILHDPSVAIPETTVRVIDAQALAQMLDLPAAVFEMGDPGRLAYIIYTSGTSGQPRAVMHGHRAIWARKMMHDGWYGIHPDDRLMHAGAFNWTFTLGTGLMDPWTVGATALIPAQGLDVAQLPRLMAVNEASIFAAAPGVYRKILAGPMPPLPRLRHGLAAGEKLSEVLRQQWNEVTGTAIYEAFGMSECSTFISASPSHPADHGRLGQPQTGRRVAIIGTDGQPVEIGAPGTIAIDQHDPGLMIGYLGAEAETRARFVGDWFLTGDQGSMEASGQITYLGRDDDMLNAGGFRVSPLEVEAVLAAHPMIREIGVTEVEVKAETSVIVAFYTSDAEIAAEDLDRFAAERLARYKQPRAWVRLDSLPSNANGKLSRKALRALYPRG